jgi:hypothetical protein
LAAPTLELVQFDWLPSGSGAIEDGRSDSANMACSLLMPLGAKHG